MGFDIVVIFIDSFMDSFTCVRDVVVCMYSMIRPTYLLELMLNKY
jgi:hypothetical protein